MDELTDTSDQSVAATPPPAGGSGAPGGKRKGSRKVVLVLSAVAVLIGATATGFVATSDESDGNGNAEEAATAKQTQGLEAQQTSPEGLAKGAGPGTTLAPGADDGPLVLLGELRSDRLLAARADDLISLATQSDKSGFPIVGMSPIVGAPLTVAVVGDHLLLSATNQAQLVRLDRNLGGLRTLNVKDSVDTDDELAYGGIVRISDDRAVVSVAFESKVALVDVDVTRWAVHKVVVFDDRFAGYPPLCRAADKLFLLTTRTVDVISLSLDRLASTPVANGTVGIVCDSGSAWVTGTEAPTLTEITSQGRVNRSMRWEGKGAAQLTHDPSSNTIFGSDQVARTVFACRIGGGCRGSGEVGQKPTDLLLRGTHLYVTTEGSRAIAILDSATMNLVGTVPFPGIPRTIVSLG